MGSIVVNYEILMIDNRLLKTSDRRALYYGFIQALLSNFVTLVIGY